MSTFAYTAFDAKGNPLQGDLQEKTWTQAIRRVKEMGLFPTSVKEKPRRAFAPKFKSAPARADAPTSNIRWSLPFRNVPPRVLTAFTRQMATLLDAGIPILKGLRCIAQQEENRVLRSILRQVIADIEDGSMFSEALTRHPRVFSRLYLNLIVAGETAGMLETTLARLADFMERSQKVRSKIVASLFYPASVISIAIGLLIVLAVFVIPRFKEVFSDLTGSGKLPDFTEYVLGSAGFVKEHLFLLGAVSAALFVAFRLVRSTALGRIACDRFALRLPVLGRIMRKAIIARFTRTLGTMLENGVPVLQALAITRESTGNTVFSRAIQHTHDQVKDGETLTAPLQASGIFPATVIGMIDVGEQTGALPGMLLKVAETYDDDVDNSIASALSLLEPALILFLALVVGSIVIALFLPLIEIVTKGVTDNGGAME